MKWENTLIALYLHICGHKDMANHIKELRMSNNHRPRFTDEELMTVYLFGLSKNLRSQKDIYQYCRDHLLSWFPTLPSYQAFNARLNQLASCFEFLIDDMCQTAHIQLQGVHEVVLDSMPIIVAGNSRSSRATVAKDICSKGYCSSKQMYYYGVKLHLMGSIRPNRIPMPRNIWYTEAHINDLNAARPVIDKLYNAKIYADKAYCDEDLKNKLALQNTEIITPIKASKGQFLRDSAAELYSTAVSKVRQPIESLFNWLIEKTDIQAANKVRSSKGLAIHILGRLTLACLYFIQFFNP